MLKLLLESGADVSERGTRGKAMRGMTPLMRAAGANCLKCVDLLLEKGSDPNAISAPTSVVKAGLQDLGLLTPLILASQWGNPAIVKSLLASGAKLDIRDARGLTPLIMAITSESQDRHTIELLLSKGADAEVHSSDGQTTLDWANKWGTATPITKALASHGAKTAQAAYIPPQRTKPATAITPAEAGLRSLKLLQSSNDKFFEKSGCTACHHQMLSGLLAGAAREHGLKYDEELARKQLQTGVTVSMPSRESLLQRVPGGGTPMSNSLQLMAQHAQQYPADALTDAYVHEIAGNQRLDGSWQSMSSRPPLEYSPATETAYAIRAIRLYASPGRRAEMDERISRAKTWLRNFEPQHTEERVMKILGLVWSGEKADIKQLLAAQLIDGSWAQRAGFAGDAYATGEALFALKQAGISPAHPAYKKGVAFLLNTQYEDGSWYVASRSVKFQPYFESGFPFKHDQWISAAATAWAAMAILESIP